MKRFLLILFMLLMPLQSSWAAVMSYGQHAGVGESTEHCRQAVKALDQVESTSDDGSAQSVQHGDCTFCELGHCGIASGDATSLSMAAPSLIASSLNGPKPSPFAAPPDRPQWSLHA